MKGDLCQRCDAHKGRLTSKGRPHSEENKAEASVDLTSAPLNYGKVRRIPVLVRRIPGIYLAYSVHMHAASSGAVWSQAAGRPLLN